MSGLIDYLNSWVWTPVDHAAVPKVELRKVESRVYTHIRCIYDPHGDQLLADIQRGVALRKAHTIPSKWSRRSRLAL